MMVLKYLYMYEKCKIKLKREQGQSLRDWTVILYDSAWDVQQQSSKYKDTVYFKNDLNNLSEPTCTCISEGWGP